MRMTRLYFNRRLKDRRTAALGAGGADVIHLSTQWLKRKISMPFMHSIAIMLLMGREGIRKAL